jgi:hypothetical protein
LQALEIAVIPLDVARRATLRLATRSAWLTRILGRRDSRIACLATFQVLLLFAVALRAPVALFFLGPLLLGVAHLAADVRYLVLRRAPPRPLLAVSVALALTITAVRAAVGLRHLSMARGNQIDVALGMVWIGFALAVALRGRARLALLLAPLFLGAAAYLVMHARLVELVLIHLHNVIALVAWLVLFRRRPGWALLPLALVVCLAAVLLSGSYLPWTLSHGGLVAFGEHAERLGAWLAPGVRADRGVALAVTFVFLQGVHYATWTGWIPQDDLRAEGTPTFRMSVRALSADFGPLALGLIGIVALGLIGFAAWDVRQSVSWYMNLAKAHAWFECAFLSYFVVRGRRRRAQVWQPL